MWHWRLSSKFLSLLNTWGFLSSSGRGEQHMVLLFQECSWTEMGGCSLFVVLAVGWAAGRGEPVPCSFASLLHPFLSARWPAGEQEESFAGKQCVEHFCRRLWNLWKSPKCLSIDRRCWRSAWWALVSSCWGYLGLSCPTGNDTWHKGG